MKKQLTNRLNLPQGIVNAVLNDPYDSGDCDISVTRLITPPYQRKLMNEVEQIEDASDRIWSLIGQSTHTILERAYPVEADDSLLTRQQLLEKYGHLTEQRLFMNCNGWRVSGAFDVFEIDTMFDYKVTSAWSVIGETKIEWEQQLNLLRLLAIRNGIQVERLRIIAILRDWSKMKAKIDPTYPQAQVVPVDIPVWDAKVAEDYMIKRVKAHQAENPPPCTAVERWQRDDVYAVMKDGRKSAVKLFDNETDAHRHAANLGKGHLVALRVGESVRCASYCSVSHACPQYRGEVPF
jgi:hypothetical protein